MKHILFLLGPNLNMVGIRDRHVYGTETAASIEQEVRQYADKLGLELEVFQSNHEGDIVDKIHAAYGQKDGIMINADTSRSLVLYPHILLVKLPLRAVVFPTTR